MQYSLNAHQFGYGLSPEDWLFTAVSFSGRVYADRHLELSNQQETAGRLGHRIIAVLESIPIIGILAIIIERVAAYVLIKFSETAEQERSDNKIDLSRVSKQEINAIENSSNNESPVPLIIQAITLVFGRSDAVIEDKYQLDPFRERDSEKDYQELLKLIPLIPITDINRYIVYSRRKEKKSNITLLNQTMSSYSPQPGKRLELVKLLLKQGADPRIKGYSHGDRSALEMQLGENPDDDSLRDELAKAVHQLELPNEN